MSATMTETPADTIRVHHLQIRQPHPGRLYVTLQADLPFGPAQIDPGATAEASVAEAAALAAVSFRQTPAYREHATLRARHRELRDQFDRLPVREETESAIKAALVAGTDAAPLIARRDEAARLAVQIAELEKLCQAAAAKARAAWQASLTQAFGALLSEARQQAAQARQEAVASIDPALLGAVAGYDVLLRQPADQLAQGYAARLPE